MTFRYFKSIHGIHKIFPLYSYVISEKEIIVCFNNPINKKLQNFDFAIGPPESFTGHGLHRIAP